MCINSVKETCFSQKYQQWICLILELNSSIVHGFNAFQDNETENTVLFNMQYIKLLFFLACIDL